MTKKTKRNTLAQELHEERDGVYKLRVVEPKRYTKWKKKPHEIESLTEEELEELE